MFNSSVVEATPSAKSEAVIEQSMISSLPTTAVARVVLEVIASVGRVTEPVTTKSVVVALVEVRLVIVAVLAVKMSKTVVPRRVRLDKASMMKEKVVPLSTMEAVFVVELKETEVISSSVEEDSEARSTEVVAPFSMPIARVVPVRTAAVKF